MPLNMQKNTKIHEMARQINKGHLIPPISSNDPVLRSTFNSQNSSADDLIASIEEFDIFTCELRECSKDVIQFAVFQVFSHEAQGKIELNDIIM